MTFQTSVLQPSEEDVVEALGLLKHCLGEKPTQRRENKFWNWKHRINPFGPSILLVARKCERLAGLRAFLQWEWQANGLTCKAVRAVDTATHPDFQRKGIFSRLTIAGLEEAKKQRIKFVFNTPNSNSMPGYLKMGWNHVSRLPMHVKILRPFRFVRGLARAKLFGAEESESTQDSFFKKQPIDVSALFDNDPEINLGRLIALDQKFRGAGYTTSRSLEFCRWRYCSHPFVPYYVETVKKNKMLLAALFYRTNVRFGLHEIMISDILVTDDSSRLIRELIAKLCMRVRADYLIAHFGPNSVHLKRLQENGFFRLPGQGINFTVRLLEQNIEPDPLEPNQWSLCLADLEIF